MTDTTTEIIMRLRQGKTWSDSMRTFISSTDASDIDRQTFINTDDRYHDRDHHNEVEARKDVERQHEDIHQQYRRVL